MGIDEIALMLSILDAVLIFILFLWRGNLMYIRRDGEYEQITRTPPSFTNADRIRSMTDEELAYFLNEIEAEAIKRAGRYLTKTEIERGKAQRLDWLKQEVITDG